jgi:threonine/homoserine/homoserine lactone efflux protein
MNLNLLAKGFLIGLSVAAPVGPMAVLCIHRTLAKGANVGLVSGLGIATADALYASVAAFGWTFLSDRLMEFQNALKLVGGLFLLYLGAKVFLSKPAKGKATTQERDLGKAYSSTFLLTLSNPPTIFLFLALFTTIGTLGRDGGNSSAPWLVTGVFLGSAFWWLVLNQSVSLLGRKMNPDKLRWINQVSGLVIAGFGLVALGSLLKK